MPSRECEIVRELARVPRDLAIDLPAQLRSGAAVDSHEGDPRTEEGQQGEPAGQTPAQSGGAKTSQAPVHGAQAAVPRR